MDRFEIPRCSSRVDTKLLPHALRPHRHRGRMHLLVRQGIRRDVLLKGFRTDPNRDRGEGSEQRGIAGDRPPATGDGNEIGGKERRRTAREQRAGFTRKGKAGKAPLRREQLGEVGRLRAEHCRRHHRPCDDEGERNPDPLLGLDHPEEREGEGDAAKRAE